MELTKNYLGIFVLLAASVSATPVTLSPSDCKNVYHSVAPSCLNIGTNVTDCDTLNNVTACVNRVFGSCSDGFRNLFMAQNIQGLEALKDYCSESNRLQTCDIVAKSYQVESCTSPYMSDQYLFCANLPEMRSCINATIRDCSERFQQIILSNVGYSSWENMCLYLPATRSATTVAPSTTSSPTSDAQPSATPAVTKQRCSEMDYIKALTCVNLPNITNFTDWKICNFLKPIERCYTEATLNCSMDDIQYHLNNLRTYCKQVETTLATTKPPTSSRATSTPPPTTASPVSTTTSTPPPTTAAPVSTTTSNTSLSPPYQCHSCHSGGQDYDQVTQCPASGQLNGWAAGHTVTCQGHCVTAVKRYPLGDVIRGCSDMFYLGNDVTPPDNQCVTVNQDIVCFCKGDKCNKLDARGKRVAFIRGHQGRFYRPFSTGR